MKYHDETFTFPAAGHYAEWVGDNPITGIIQLPEGAVEAEAYVSDFSPGLSETMLEFVANGHVYRRTYNKYFSRRHIITLAKRFVNDVKQKPIPR